MLNHATNHLGATKIIVLLRNVKQDQVYTTTQVNEFCGRVNTPLGAALRSCFVRVNDFVAKSFGEGFAFQIDPKKLKELQQYADEHIECVI